MHTDIILQQWEVRVHFRSQDDPGHQECSQVEVQYALLQVHMGDVFVSIEK